MIVIAPFIKLNNSIGMPALGLGTSKAKGNEGLQATKDAIDAGYRHFDTAYMYGNEAAVGQGIREKIAEGVVKREEIFYVTKLWCTDMEVSRVEQACRRSLINAGLAYIDLYLIHFPVAFANRGDELFPRNADGSLDTLDTDYIDIWREMEKLVPLGLVRSIGISNFNSVQIERLLSVANIKPVVNQIEVSPRINQRKLIKLCADHGIVVTAYSPLGRPDMKKRTPSYFFDDKVEKIAVKYGKTSAQVVLRYLLELGTVPIPKSTTKSRIKQNIDIFDIKLNPDEVQYLNTFNTGERLIDHCSDAKHAKHYPFLIEF